MTHEEPVGGRVTDQAAIIQLILQAREEGQHIRLHMDQQFLEYVTHFKTGPEPGDFLYLYIGALVPPIGNIKIRKSHGIAITFLTKNHVVETKVRFLRAVTKEMFRLSFPRYVKMTAQKRSAVRVAPCATMKLSLGILPSDGIELVAQLVDLSAEGLSFLFARAEHYLPKDAAIQIVLSWGDEGQQVTVDALVVGHVTRDVVEGYRAKLIFSSVEQTMLIEKLVADMQCQILQQRIQVSGENHIKKWEVKTLGREDIPTSKIEDLRDRYDSQWIDKGVIVEWFGIILALCAGLLIALNIYVPWAFPMLVVGSLMLGMGLLARHRTAPLALVGFLILLGVIGSLRVWW